MTIQVPSKYIQALMLFVSRETRIQLRGLYFVFGEERETIIMASNGRIIGCFKVPCVDGERVERFVPIELLEKLSFEDAHIAFDFSSDGNSVSISDHGATITGCTPGYKLPRIKNFMISKTSGVAAMFDSKHLAVFEAANLLVSECLVGISISFNGSKLAPVSIGCDDFFGALMPLNNKTLPDKTRSTPEWVNEFNSDAE